MRYFLSLLILIFSTTATVWAQSKTDLERFFQGQTVTLRIDLPATKDGVNIYPERAQPFDYKEYEKRINRHGALVRGYEMVTISALNVSGKQIEVLVAGYGTPRNVARFNIHFNCIESWMLTPASVIDALKSYVEFQPDTIASSRHSGGAVRRGVVKFGPRTTYLKEGLRTQEVLRLLGKPSSISESSEQGAVVTRYEFDRSEGRTIVAEFIGDSLIRSRTETRVASFR